MLIKHLKRATAAFLAPFVLLSLLITVRLPYLMSPKQTNTEFGVTLGFTLIGMGVTFWLLGLVLDLWKCKQ